jgi:hypothetical protein
MRRTLRPVVFVEEAHYRRGWPTRDTVVCSTRSATPCCARTGATAPDARRLEQRSRPLRRPARGSSRASSFPVGAAQHRRSPLHSDLATQGVRRIPSGHRPRGDTSRGVRRRTHRRSADRRSAVRSRRTCGLCHKVPGEWWVQPCRWPPRLGPRLRVLPTVRSISAEVVQWPPHDAAAPPERDHRDVLLHRNCPAEPERRHLGCPLAVSLLLVGFEQQDPRRGARLGSVPHADAAPVDEHVRRARRRRLSRVHHPAGGERDRYGGPEGPSTRSRRRDSPGGSCRRRDAAVLAWQWSIVCADRRRSATGPTTRPAPSVPGVRTPDRSWRTTADPTPPSLLESPRRPAEPTAART